MVLMSSPQWYLRLLLGHKILLYSSFRFDASCLLTKNLTAGAIIFTVIALFSILSYFGFRSRIPLASLLLQVVMDVSKHHKSVYVVAFIALLLQAAMAVYVVF